MTKTTPSKAEFQKMADFENVEDITEEIPSVITEGDEEEDVNSGLQDEEEEEEEELEEDEEDDGDLAPLFLPPDLELQEEEDAQNVPPEGSPEQTHPTESILEIDVGAFAVKVTEDLEKKQLEIETLQHQLQERVDYCSKLEQKSHEIDEQNEVLGKQLNEAQTQCEALKGSVTEYEMSIEQLNTTVDELRQRLQNSEQELKETQSSLVESRERVQELSIPPPDVPGADRQELLRLLDRRQHEIGRLSHEWKSLSSKLETTSAEKSEFQTKYDEVITQEASLRLREQLLQQEKQLVKSQNEWLSHELQTKTDQLLQLKKERASTTADMESRMSAKDQEVKRLNTVLETLRQSHSELEAKATEYLNRMREGRDEQAAIEEQLKKELAQQAKLSDLYHKASDDAQGRVKELVGAVEKLQSLVEEVSQEKDQLQLQFDEENSRHESLEQDHLTEVERLKKELSHANDLLASLRQQRGAMLSDTEVLSLSPAAAKASAMLKSGQSLTQIYSQYVEVSEELQLQKDENFRLNNYIEQIVQDLDEKTPALQQLRRDYDRAEQNCQQLSQKLNGMFEECESMRLESEDARRNANADKRENERLKQLCNDLGRQVKVLLKECEEARGGVASTSMSHDLSSGDISSSSQVITQHLVDFRNIDELQEQNQRLLEVVRELSEQNEERERQTLEQHTSELQTELSTALREIEELREARERQKEFVQSIVNQRDMYRTLLAQATPLPPDTQQQQSTSTRHDDDSVEVDGPQQGEAAKTLMELKEQFEAYRREKKENDAIMQSQMDELREQSSDLRLDNAKLTSKLEYSNERYQLLDSHHKALKKELDALREKNQQLSTTLSKQQTSVHTATQELFSLQEKLSKAEIAYQSMRTERDMLKASEQQARSQYSDLLKEQKGQTTLLTNLQTIQNNLEKSEFETKTRLGSKIEALEKELVLFKDKLHSEEERRTRMSDAYETRVKDLDQKLSSTKDALSLSEDKLRSSEEKAASLLTELNSTKQELDSKQKELQENKDKVLRLEQDAGGEFRGKIRLLERNLADSKGKVKSLETQLSSAKSHAEQYKEMSANYEQQLKELNETSEEFKSRVEHAQAEAEARENELKLRVDDLEVANKEREEELQKVKEECVQEVSGLQSKLSEKESERAALQLELTSNAEELENARQDVKRYLDDATTTKSLYQRELLQHSNSMKALVSTEDKLKTVQSELAQLKVENQHVLDQMSADRESWVGKETRLSEQCQNLEARMNELTQQNTLLHDESEKLSAQLITATQHTQELDTSVPEVSTADTSLSDKSTEQLWEIIRYVRREKEISQTKQELAESENTRNKQLVEHLQRQLSEAQDQLREVGEAARVHSETAAQHAEILAKVESLNVLSDSNKLLRAERDSLATQIKEMEQKCEKFEGDMAALRETNKQLTAQKDVLVAEKTALRNEAQRWSTRTNQLIEQYNKVDPEEYKKLLEEKESTTVKIDNLEREVNTLQPQLTEAQAAKEKLETELNEVKGEKESLSEEVKQLQTDLTAKQEGLQAKDNLIHRLREIGRKFRTKHEESQKEVKELKEECEALKKKAEEAPPPSETPPVTSDQPDKTKELEEAQKTIEELQTSKAQLEEKGTKMGKMVKAAKARIQALTAEKQQAAKELEDAKAEGEKLSGELANLQQELKQLQEKYDADTKKQEMNISKLQQMLKERRPRHKAVVPISEGVSSLPSSQTTAPTAAVKPTVTTTPTASIRPIKAIQTTSAPTAHVTPTMVTVQHVVPATTTTPFMSANQISSNVISNSTAAATMFVRSSSPQIVTPLPTTSISVASTTSTSPPVGIAVASQESSGEGVSRGTVKRQREDDTQEPGSTLEPPASKRQRPILQQQPQQVAASTSLAPDTQGEGEGVNAMDTQPSDSQVSAAETQVQEQPSASEPSAPEFSVNSQSISGTQASEAMQTQVVSVSPVSTETMDTMNATGVSSQVGRSSPIVSSLAQSRVSESPPAQVTQSREATQIRVSDSSGLGIVQPIQAHVDRVQVPSSEAMQAPVQSAETSLVQTTSEAMEAPQPEELTSEVQQQQQPMDDTSASREVTESVSQQAQPAVAYVDSSESILSEDVSQEAHASQPPAESSPTTSRVKASVVHVGIVEPNRPEVEASTQQEQGESVSEVERQERDSSEVQLLEEQIDVEVSAPQAGEATLEMADTTQKEELRAVSEPVSEVTSEVEGEVVQQAVESEDDVEVDVVGGDDVRGEGDAVTTLEEEEEDERMGEEGEETVEETETTGESQDDEEEEGEEEEEEGEEEEEDDTEGRDQLQQAGEESGIIDQYSRQSMISEELGPGEGSQSSPIVIDSGGEEEEEEEDDVKFEVRVDLSDEEISEEEKSDSEERDEVVELPAPQDQVGVQHDQQQGQPHPLVYQRSTSSMESEQSSSGLPEDEVSMDIPTHTQPPLRPTSFPIASSGRRRYGERQTSLVTPQTFVEVHAEDSVVPHTPVLGEVKQLVGNMGQTIPSTPSEPSYTVPQLAESSLTAESMRASEVIQSLGESQIEELGPAIVPPPNLEASHDPNQLVTQDGDINDELINDIVERDSSPEDEEEMPEEGELEEDDEDDEQLEQPQDDSSGAAIASASAVPALTSSVQPFTPHPASSGATQHQALPRPPPLRPLDSSKPVSSSSVAGEGSQEASGSEPPSKRKPEPIVWETPSSSSGGSAPPPAASGGRGSQGRGGRGRRVVRAPTAQGSRRNIRLKQPRKA